jgi:hypothetical protein
MYKGTKIKKYTRDWLGRPGTCYMVVTGTSSTLRRIVFQHWHDTDEITWRDLSGDGSKGTLVTYASGQWHGGADEAKMLAAGTELLTQTFHVK